MPSWRGFIGPSYESQSWRFDQERVVNLYPVPSESQGSTSQMAYFPTPGVETLGDPATTGEGRAHFFENGREWAVFGTGFYEISQAGVKTLLGTVAVDARPATISSNGDAGGELFITSGTNGYIYDLSADTFSQIAALNGIASQGDHLDGFFIAIDAATGTMYISDLLDGTTWDTSTQFAQRSSQPDPWIALKVSSPYIWLFGSQTSDVWFNAGTAPFPFAPHPSGQVRYGCAGASLPTVVNGELVWVAQSKIGEAMVLRAAGFTPERITTFPVQRILQGYASLSAGIGDSYEDGGHVFVNLAIPDAPVTWCYEISSGYWHERGTWIAETASYVPWRPRFHAFAFGEHRWLDSETGELYRASIDINTDVDDRELRRMRRAPVLQYMNQRIFYGAFELLLDSGVGNAVPPGDNPQVMLRYSNDGGKTWGPEMLRSAGKVGEYSRRVRWERGGMATQRVVEVSFSDPVAWRITDAFLDLVQVPRGLNQGAA